LLLAHCLLSLNNIYLPYFYKTIGSASISGRLSHLLCVTDEQLMSIYQSWGFFNVKRNCFSNTIFQAFIEGLNVWIDIARYKKPASPICSLLVRIGQGSYPSKPLHHQVKDQQQPPNHQLKKEERQLVASLLKLCCCQEPDTTSTADTSPPSVQATIATSSIPDTRTMCQKLEIHIPDKAALVIELVEEI
jgi:hypothetical protein